MRDTDHPLLTIVTVVKDDPSGLTRTVRSMARQRTPVFDLVVIDSSSDRDAVLSVLEGALSVPVDYSWMQPQGVYPAMNAGLERVRGHYSIFLNAGDELHDEHAGDRIATGLEANPVWAYGGVRFIDPSGRTTTPPPFDYKQEASALFSRGRFPPHQGTIARSSTLKELGGFDTRYRIVADYALMLRLSRTADPSVIPGVIADFHTGGLSSVDWRASIDEFHHARREILQPTGLAAIGERINTRAQIARMHLARMMHRL